MIIFHCERAFGLALSALSLAACGIPTDDRADAAAGVPVATTAGVESSNDDGSRITVDEKLKSMGPDGWHRLALYANWDYTDNAVWRWIIHRPDCDKATALAIFWKAQPNYFAEFPNRAAVPLINRPGYDLVTAIRDRWLAGRYRRSELSFMLDDDAGPFDFAALDRRFGARAIELMPPSMRISLAGRRIEDVGEPLPGVLRSG